MKDQWIVIVNPNSGKRKGEKDWHIIEPLLKNAGILFKPVFTGKRLDAAEMLAVYTAKGYIKFIVIGGDGTLNEAANGIMLQKSIPNKEITLGVIPVGKGNDWCRSFGIPYNYQKAIDIIKAGKTVYQDVGKVSYFYKGEKAERYFFNVAGMGFDAEVASKVNHYKEKGKDAGELAYFRHIFSCLFGYKAVSTKFIMDGKVLRTEVFSMCVGICKYNGGGMMQLPYANPSDGLLDLTIIKKIGPLKVILNVRRLFDGTIEKIKEVELHQARSIIIDAEKPTNIEVDGESLGHSPFEFSIIPSCLKVICA
jgi:diacylglycerol kinase (ATP)